MFAIFTTGSKQYKVEVNDKIFVEKLELTPGTSVEFDKVLMIDSDLGAPYLSGAKVVCEVVKQGKQDKIHIIHHRPQKHHTKHQGHRQPYTQLLIKEIVK
jgi:large subunit ribosomal protein L21